MGEILVPARRPYHVSGSRESQVETGLSSADKVESVRKYLSWCVGSVFAETGSGLSWLRNRSKEITNVRKLFSCQILKFFDRKSAKTSSSKIGFRGFCKKSCTEFCSYPSLPRLPRLPRWPDSSTCFFKRTRWREDFSFTFWTDTPDCSTCYCNDPARTWTPPCSKQRARTPPPHLS